MGPLVICVIWALFVATTLWFPFRRGMLGHATFVLTMTCNEIPLILLVVFIASVAASLGDADGGEGITVAALAVACLVMLAMVWLQLRVRSVQPAFETALAASLGPGWRASIRPGLVAPSRPNAPWLWGIILPFQRHLGTVERVRNVPYASGGRGHLLDIYRSKDPSTGRPVLIHLHGGGFVRGGKSRESVALLNQLANHGWFCVSANYGLRTHGTFPQPLVDTKRVIAWVRANAGEHGTDPCQIFLAGGSAGGHLAISAALTAGDPRFQPGFEQADTKVAGAISLYGYLGPLSNDPASLARKDAPPLLIVHPQSDTTLPPGLTRSAAATLDLASRSPVVYAELPDTQHNFDFFASVRARVAANSIEAFLGWARSHNAS